VVAHAKERGGHHDPHDSKAHEKHYIKIWALLVGLLVLSMAGPLAADLAHLTGFVRYAIVLPTAFGIALVKAYYVVKHFMHLNVEPKFVGYICATALAFMALFFFFVAPDVMKHEGRNWENVLAKVRHAGPGHGPGHGEHAEFDAHVAFEGTCANCHGPTGQGNGAASGSLTPRPANFQDPTFWQTRDRAHIVKVITEGGASVGKSPLMAAFGASYTPEQIEQLADLVMSFRPAEPEPTPEPLPRIEPEPEPEPEIVEVVPPEPAPGISEADQRARADFIRQRLYQN
jgi:caa(3)-type oxidase subunit IV